ncbi:DMP19 family protein [Agarilytica rhodophyticola]|uniref:DMP19 family protein n=1 Tax=Agarilytica rhodophyticola TaxID=1737490 RepID=UPI000B342675|nr:DUF4375 domain-containing protein [Agarilytica rhodophyticola]
MDRIACKNCGAKALPSTIEKTGGLCMPCFKGQDQPESWRTGRQIVEEMESIKQSIAAAKSALKEDSENANRQSQRRRNFLTTIAQRHSVDNSLLQEDIYALLMEKQAEQGAAAFSRPEQVFYTVSDMLHQLNSGGFSSYLYNSGHLAHLLSDSLKQIGAVRCKNIVDDAISIYGKTPAQDYDVMLQELSHITNNFDNDLWAQQDCQFYYLDENILALLIKFAANNTDQFTC